MRIATTLSCWWGGLRSTLLALMLAVFWTGSAHAVLITVTATGTTGSFKTGSVDAAGTKNDGDMININSFTNRGWAVFDLTTLPTGAVINSVTANFTTFNTTLSGATNYLGGFVGDPATIPGATLYTLLNADFANNFSASTWAGNATGGTLNTLSLNPAGLAFIGGAAGSSTVVISYVRGSTNTYNIYGYGAATGSIPELIIDYTPPVACTGAPTPGTTAASATAVCPSQAVTFTLPGIVPGTGNLTYQWQSSTNGTTYANIAGATASTYTSTFSTNTWIQCIVTCTNSSLSTTSVPAAITVNSFLSCYCASNATSTGDEEIFNVTVNGISNTSNCTSVAPGAGSIAGQYGNYTTLPPINCFIGTAVPFSVDVNTCGGNYNSSVKIYIDLNQNGSLSDPGEEIFASAAAVNGPHTVSGTFLVPIGTAVGNTLMRVVNVETAPAFINPCGTYTWGETEDYLVNFIQPTGCTGATAGNTASTDSTVCATQTFTLSMPNTVIAGGLTYQWQSSPDNINWTNIAGANNVVYSTTQSVNTWYRCVITCTQLNVTDISVPLQIQMNSFLSCYCNSTATSTFDEEILEVSLNGTPNASTCSTLAPGPGSVQNLYSNYTTLPPVSCFLGTAVPFSVTIGTCNGNYTNNTKIYIDYNQNGSFADPGEEVFATATGSVGPNVQSGTFLIPVTATPGITMMRVINVETFSSTAINPCGTYTWGETEDYLVNLIQPVACAGAVAGNTASTDSSVCSGQNFTLSMPNTVITSGLTYTWQVSTDSIAWTTIAGANNIVATTSQTDTSWYRCIVTCTAVSVADTSDALKVVMAPFLSCYCGSQANFTWSSDIGQVVLGGFANPAIAPPATGPAAAQYTNFTTLSPGPQLTLGGVTPISVLQVDQFGVTTSALSVYIDFNHDGTYDLAENVFNSGSVNGNPMTGSVLVPMAAQLGLTGMRVILTNFGTTPLDPCVNYGTGETEDYLVNIVAPIPFNGQMVAIYSPGSGCGLTSCEDLSFDIRNAGADSLSTIGYAYSVNNGAPIAASFTPGVPLAPGDISSIIIPCGVNLATPGTYTIKVWVQIAGDTDPMLDTLVKTVVSIPTVTTFPYVQNFDNPANPTGGWVSGSLPGSAGNSWALGTPAKPVINAAASAPNSWITNLTSDYLSGERSFVESPCLNFSTLTLPIVEMKIWWESESGWDGTVLQSSIDGGLTWQTIGGLGTGQNWYNDQQPFMQTSAPFGSTAAWSGYQGDGSGGWLSAKHTLTGLGLQPSVKLRFGFAADVFTSDGFAFDDLMIYDTPPNDLSAQSFTAPVSGDCGDDSTALVVVIKNTGLNAQSNFPVSASYNNGAGAQGTLTMTYTGTLQPDSTATVVIGTFNSLVGGPFALTAYTDLSNDGFHLNDTIRTTAMISSVPASPLTTDVYKCQPDSFLLSVASPTAGMFYTWYDSISGGTMLDTGVNFMTPFLTQTTPYYVSVQGNQAYQINTNVTGGTGTYWMGYTTIGLEFTNTYAMTIDSVTIYPTGAGNIQLVVIDPLTGLAVDSGAVVSVAGAGMVRIPVGISVPTAGVYNLMASTTSTVPNLTYNWSGGNFPYSAGGVSITENTDGSGIWGNYFFFYDWAITTLGCPSERTAATAGIFPTPVVNLGADFSACGGDTLNAGSGWVTTVWSYDNTVIGTGQIIFADTTGAFELIVTDINGCVGGDTINLQINPLPSVELGNDTTVCGGFTIDAGNPGSSFSWGCAAVPTFTQTLSVALTGNYCATVTNQFGCQATDSIMVTVNTLPQVNLGNDVQTCSPVSLSSSTVTPNSTCSWTLPGGGTSASCTTTASASGTYVLTVTDANGCVGSDDVLVTFQPGPIANIGNGGTDTVCTSAVLNAGNTGSTYLWTTPTGQATTQSVTAATTGLYKVVVTSSIGCKHSDSVNLVVNVAPAKPGIAIGFTGKAFEYLFTATNVTGIGNTYSWSFTNSSGGVTTANGNPVTVSFPSTVDFYDVKVVATNDCGSANTTETLLINGTEEGLNAVVSVYPNPTDGVAYVSLKGLSQDVHLTIYDANGRSLMSRTITQFEQREALKLDLSEFAKGTYLMRFDTEQGTATRKITLQ